MEVSIVLRKKPSRIPHAFACLSLATAFLNIPVLAWGVDAAAAEPNFTLAKLQDLTSRASELAVRAVSMLGINYKYGGTTPENGLDCSGLVRYVFKEAWGASLPRTSEEISRVGERVAQQDLQPGDLVFYNTLKRGFSHVGIYLGDNKFIHSPSAGGQVRIESMDLSYWKKRFNGARRVNEPEAKNTTGNSAGPTSVIF
jgi:cell wall-associated NlpC family hydrolase